MFTVDYSFNSYFRIKGANGHFVRPFSDSGRDAREVRGKAENSESMLTRARNQFCGEDRSLPCCERNFYLRLHVKCVCATSQAGAKNHFAPMGIIRALGNEALLRAPI